MKMLEGEGTGVGWNSAVVVGPEGEVVGNYRKTFRFETDKAWAREGGSFNPSTVLLERTDFKVMDLHTLICRNLSGEWQLGFAWVSSHAGRLMLRLDINPRDFIAPWDAFELATYCRDNSVDTLVLP